MIQYTFQIIDSDFLQAHFLRWGHIMHMCNLNDEDTGKQWQSVEIYIKFYAKKNKTK
jgi:hypothetical protein